MKHHEHYQRRIYLNHNEIYYPGERDGGGRLSMWGEQLHDKLFAKKDMKDVMRNKLKLNPRDDNNDSPQNSHANIEYVVPRSWACLISCLILLHFCILFIFVFSAHTCNYSF